MTPAKKKAAVQEALADLGIVPKWEQFKELKQLGFARLCEKRQTLHDEIEFRKTKMAEIDEEIEAALGAAGTEKVIWEDRAVQIVTKEGSRKLSAQLLLNKGVEADVIAECTEQGKSYSYLLFGKPKKE
jgi:hypothetical protein